MKNLTFLDNNGTFELKKAQEYSYLYFPIASGTGLKSCVTPELAGDAKTDQNHFLLQPVSSQELHNNKSTRNFWIRFESGKYFSATGVSALQQAEKFSKKSEDITVTAGLMWQKISRENKKYKMRTEVLTFVPEGTECEVMMVTLTNTSDNDVTFTPIAAVPIYGRSADNLRDHRHVSSLLHRVVCTEDGVCVQPVLSFDERGHRRSFTAYFVAGADENGAKPEGFYPVVDEYIGEGGSYEVPEAVARLTKAEEAGFENEGYEAVGGIRFAEKTLKTGESATYIVLIGIKESETETAKLSCYAQTIMSEALSKLGTAKKVEAEFERTKKYWTSENNIAFHTKDANFDNYMKWISFQPIIRRIYGCSFLPHHDYGKGGRGWRDLWQDQLALLMMNPTQVGEMLLNNYCGVRMDGSNATIIGSKPGEFVADRNNIVRVWMDHGLWPYMTTELYVHQTGDYKLLFKPAVYFKDKQAGRGTLTDKAFDEKQGTKQLTPDGKVYEGTVLEHILVQNLTAFYEVGEHNHMRLRGADWNDALDMAPDRGESVAFTAAYAGNLEDLSVLLNYLADNKDVSEITLLKEIMPLLSDKRALYDDIDAKTKLLKEYMESVEHFVSGEQVSVSTKDLAKGLHNKAKWLKDHLRKTEWLEEGWFNSYYDNNAGRVEGTKEDGSIRMMLTGQVFSIMGGTATDSQIRSITSNADKYLYDKKRGGYALNTNFRELKTDLGRMFGFGYGQKENGAVFSHMTTMYGNALYKRGFASKGYKALDTLYRQAANMKKSDIYPGIPEYFDDKGRGMYHYLTGAASWYLLTALTQMFGIKGEYGDLVLEPKLMANQFDENGLASASSLFAGRMCKVEYRNLSGKDYGHYSVAECFLDNKPCGEITNGRVLILRSVIESLDTSKLHTISVVLK